MGMNFHSGQNRDSYTRRKADATWIKLIEQVAPIEKIRHACDIGCGGGIYAQALSDMGIPNITGIDFSKAILDGARENCKNYPNISFKLGNALDTGLRSRQYDLVLARALIHHIDRLDACFAETYRLLRDQGMYIVQDRTPEDCLLPGNDRHIRGYFFSMFPRLKEAEIQRRYASETVHTYLTEAGFQQIREFKLWETRRTYDCKEQLFDDLRKRTGRSILHELNDVELEQLIDELDRKLTAETIVEKDRWTVWTAVK